MSETEMITPPATLDEAAVVMNEAIDAVQRKGWDRLLWFDAMTGVGGESLADFAKRGWFGMTSVDTLRRWKRFIKLAEAEGHVERMQLGGPPVPRPTVDWLEYYTEVFGDLTTTPMAAPEEAKSIIEQIEGKPAKKRRTPEAEVPSVAYMRAKAFESVSKSITSTHKMVARIAVMEKKNDPDELALAVGMRDEAARTHAVLVEYVDREV